MCGRYSLTTPVEGLRQLFEFDEQPNLRPRYNIAPTQEVAAVRTTPPSGQSAETGSKRHLVLLRWGLIPSWAKDASIAARMINARAETVAEKPAFRAAFLKRRCLVLADGFYEWQKREAGAKQPYWISRRDGGPFAFAGLWERWRNPADDTVVESCTIVTTDANAVLRPIHTRMPVILAPEAFDLWLDAATEPERLRAALGAEPADDLVATAITTRVNKVANDDPEVLRPLDQSARPDQPQLL